MQTDPRKRDFGSMAMGTGVMMIIFGVFVPNIILPGFMCLVIGAIVKAVKR